MTSIRSSGLLQPGRKASPGIGGLNGAASHLGHNFSDAVQFSGNTPPQSYWVRLRQGLQRLWQKVAGPFQRLTAWIQKNWTQKKVDPPVASAPAKVATEAAAKPNVDHKLTTPKPPEVQQALTHQKSGSELATSPPESSNPVALPPAGRDVVSVPPASSAQGVIVPPTEPYAVELAPIRAQEPSLGSPTTPTASDPPIGPTPSSEPTLEIQEAQDLQTAIKLSRISADQEAANRLAQEEMENHQLNQALQISGDEALAKKLAAEKNRTASSVQPLATDSPKGPGTPPGGQAVSVRTTPPSIPVEALFGRDLTSIRFQQKGGNTCYLLSALDVIFHHPQGKQILAKIQITRTPGGYSVQFPGQPQAITVKAEELGNLRLASGTYVSGVQSKCLGVRILECAYSKIPNPVFGQYDESKNALTRIFGPDHEVINIQNSRNPSKGVIRNANGRPVADDGTPLPWQGDHRIGPFEFTHDERIEQFRQYIQNARSQEELDIITAKPFNEAHYYSVRAHQSTPKIIVLADPFNTGHSIKVKFDDFMKRYDIEGIRLPR